MTSLRREPRFVRWATAEGISYFGSAITLVVLPLVVYDATGSAAQTGLVYALRVVPYLLFGVIAGPIADRGNRRLLIIGGNVVEGILVATIPLASALGVLTVAQVYVVGLLSATAFVFADAAVFGAVPALVGRERLAAANGVLASLASAADIAGPALGGVLAATIGADNAIWLDSASFLIAAAVLSTIPGSFRTGAPPARIRIRTQIRRGLRFVRAHRTVAILLGVGFGNSFAFGAVLGLVVPFAVEQLDLGNQDARIGILYSATGVGALIAGLVLGRLFRAERVRWITPGTLAVSAVAIAGLVLATRWPVAALLYALMSWSTMTTIVVGITYRQLAAPDDLRSSVNVLGRMISWGGQPFGAAVGGIVAQAHTVGTAYVVAAGVMATTAAIATTLLARGVDPVPVTA